MSDAGKLGIREILRIPEIRAAMLGTFVIMLGFGILFPVLPKYARSFGVGYDGVGILVASFSLTRLAFDPFAGRLIDRYGERAMAAIGALIVGATSALAALAPTFELLVVLRGAGGVGSAVFFAALLSYLIRTVPRERTGRVMSVYYASFNIGIIAGQPLGGLFAAHLGLASPLWIYGISCGVSAWLLFRTIRNPERSEHESRHRGLRRLPWDRPFVTVLVVNAAYLWFIGGVFSTLIPLFGNERVGLSISGVGFGLSIATATEFAVLFSAGKATDRAGRKAVLVPSFIALVVLLTVFGLATSSLLFMVALAILGVISGYAGVPAAPMLSDLAPEELSGTAVGVFRFAGDLGFVLGPLVSGFAADHFDFGPAFAVNAIPCAIALALVLSIRETMPVLPRTGDAPGL
ncbi:MAG: MFS transporter [Actinomycetota bacterium]